MSKKADSPPAEPIPIARPLRPAAFNADASDAGSMEKIRDILFGNQVRDFERRFVRMEEHLNRSAADLRDEVTRRLEALERFFKEELETLKGRIKNEAEKRSETEKRLADELKGSAAALESTIRQIEEKLADRTTDLRQLILQQSKELSGEIQARQEQANRALAQAVERLEESKINRAMLAEHLVEIAMRLSNHPQAPGPEEAAP